VQIAIAFDKEFTIIILRKEIHENYILDAVKHSRLSKIRKKSLLNKTDSIFELANMGCPDQLKMKISDDYIVALRHR